MKDRIKAEIEELNNIVREINNGKQQISRLEGQALTMQGRIQMLKELEAEEITKE
jgi:hypothetical protein